MKISNSLLIWINIELGHLREYSKLNESLLRDKKKEFDAWADKEASKLSEEQKEEFYDFYSDDHWEFAEVYPNILRESLFVACVSLVEHQLINLCKHLQRENKYNIELNDIVGKGIYKAKLYLNKVASIGNNVSWEKVLIFQKIRNFVVHNGGKLDDSNNAREIEKYVTTNALIKLDQFKRIQLSSNFCPEMIKEVDEFFKDIFKDLQAKV